MNNPIFILLVVASQLFLNAETNNNPGILNLINLGQVDGKNYFYETITQRNWTAAGNYCRESGMQLATIETQAQAEFLKSKYDSQGFRAELWTAGRDAHLPREFTWNNTGTTPTEISGLPWTVQFVGMEYQTCVMYNARPSPTMNMYPCARTTSGVLCQT